MKGILINNGKALGDGSGKVFTVQSEKGNPVTVYTEGEMDSLIIAENVDKIFKYIGDDGDYTKDHIYQVVDENGTLTVKDLSMGIPLPPVTNIQLDSSGVLSWDAPDTTELADKLVSINYKINFNGNELTTAKNLISVYSFAVEGQNEASVQAIFTLNMSGKTTDEIIEWEFPTEPVVILLDVKLETPMKQMVSSKVDKTIYLFGGQSNVLLRTIYKFDTENETLTKINRTLPSECYNAPAVAIGTDIYIIGGRSGSYLNTIVKFDTLTEYASKLSVTLPNGLESCYAEGYDKTIYILGGSYSFTYYEQIYKFDTETQTLTTLNTVLPKGRAGSVSSIIGEDIYIFSGTETGSNTANTILKFNITTETITTLDLTTLKNIQAAIPVGPNIYLFGGSEGNNYTGTIFKFDVISETLTLLSPTLLTPFDYHMYGYALENVGNTAYAFGGANPMKSESSDFIQKILNL